VQVDYGSVCPAPRDAFRHESGMGVNRPSDVWPRKHRSYTLGDKAGLIREARVNVRVADDSPRIFDPQEPSRLLLQWNPAQFVPNPNHDVEQS